MKKITYLKYFIYIKKYRSRFLVFEKINKKI